MKKLVSLVVLIGLLLMALVATYELYPKFRSEIQNKLPGPDVLGLRAAAIVIETLISTIHPMKAETSDLELKIDKKKK